MSTIQILNNTEKELFVSHAESAYYRDFVMITLCLTSGLRNSELIQLIISDILRENIVSHDILVRPEIAKGGFMRSVPIPTSTVILLNEFLLWKKTNNEPYEKINNLFVSRHTHNILSPRDFQRIIKKISLKSIGRSIHPHVLRHTYATNLLKHTNLRVIQILLGHKHLSSTEIYTHPNSSDLKLAVENL